MSENHILHIHFGVTNIMFDLGQSDAQPAHSNNKLRGSLQDVPSH